MELNTFGALLKFALDLEAALARFYSEAQAAATGESLQGIFVELASAGERNRKRLEQVRRQQVNEMLLESMQGLHADDYRVDLDAGGSELPRTAIHAEIRLERFYRDAAARLSLPEVARSFRRLAEAHAQSERKLSSL